MGSGDPPGLQNRREAVFPSSVSSTLTRFRHLFPSTALLRLRSGRFRRAAETRAQLARILISLRAHSSRSLRQGGRRMDYCESVVFDYLRADRAVFVNREYCIQLNQKANPDTSGPHW